MTLTRDVTALVAFIDGRHATPHAWGRRHNDCAGYALDAVHAQTGHARATRLHWNNRAQALRVIARFGSLEAAFDHYFQRIPPALAQRGDIAGVPDATFGIHPMIVEGATLVGPGDDGNRRVKRAAMICAWSAVLPQPKRKKTAHV